MAPKNLITSLENIIIHESPFAVKSLIIQKAVEDSAWIKTEQDSESGCDEQSPERKQP